MFGPIILCLITTKFTVSVPISTILGTGDTSDISESDTVEFLANLFDGCLFRVSNITVMRNWENDKIINNVVCITNSSNTFCNHVPRHSNCSVNIHEQDLALKSDISSMSIYPKSSTFGIILLRRSWLESKQTDGFFAGISTHQTSAMYFALVIDNQSLHAICIPCPNDQKLVPVHPDHVKRDKLPSIWSGVHKNLHELPILYLDRDTLHLIDCTKVRHLEKYCQPIMLCEHLNATLVFETSPDKPKPYAVIRRTLLEFILDDGLSYEWLPEGKIIEPYTFVIVLDKATHSHSLRSVLGEVVDNFNMITVGILGIVFLFALRYRDWMRPEKPKWTVLRWIRVLIEMLETASGPLFDQGLTGRVYKRRLESMISIRPLLCIWIMSALVLCSAFKGALTSFFSKQVPDSSPRTLDELVLSSDIPILTGDTHHGHMDGKNGVSILKDIINRHINASRLSEYDLTLYKTLHRKSFLVTSSHAQIVAAYQTRVNIGSEAESPLLFYYVPRTFAYIGFKSGVEKFSSLMSRFSNVFVIINPHLDSLVSLKLVTVLSRRLLTTLLLHTNKHVDCGCSKYSSI